MDMALTKRRLFDVLGAAGGVLVLLVALLIIDQGIRHGLTSSIGAGVDLAAVGENMNYLALVVAVMVAQVTRGEVAEHMHLLVFTATAAVLVVFLIRM